MPRYFALDFGLKRIGLAFSEGELALALDAISNDQDSISSIARQVESRNSELIIVGLPLGLAGNSTHATENAVLFARQLSKRVQIPVRLLDERLTTKSAAARLRESGHNAKSSKALIDSQSAVQILDSALAQSKLGKTPGVDLENFDG